MESKDVLDMRLLSRYKNLRPVERNLFLRALTLLAITRVGLRILPFRVIRNWTEQFRSSAGLDVALNRRRIAQVVWAVDAASRRLPGTTCLPRAMATHFLLGRLGQKSDLRLGAALKPDGLLEAHAWVEVEGRVIIGGAVEGFQRFVPFQEKPFLNVPLN